MNILVIGAGAVGLGIASSVLSQNAEVSIFARGETAKAIKENGIQRTGLFTHYSFTKDEIDVLESIETDLCIYIREKEEENASSKKLSES